MAEKYRQSSVGAWHSVKKFSNTPKNGRPNAAPLLSDVTSTTFQASSKRTNRTPLEASRYERISLQTAFLGRPRNESTEKTGKGYEKCKFLIGTIF
jgi:hypothetical protein